MRLGGFRCAVGAVVALGLAACGRPEADSAGSPASGDRALRLAVLSPALAETLRGLGQGERIVGRHGWDSFTPSEVPVMGNEHGIDYEALLKARPSHVIVQAGARDTPARLVELAAQEKWTIVRVPLLTIDDVAASVGTLARVCGVEPSAQAEVERSFRSALGPRAGLREHAGRVLVLAGVDPPAVMGPGSFHFEMVERLGGDAIPDEGAPFIQWGVEDVVNADPDTLVLVLPGAASEEASANLGPLLKAGLRCVGRGSVVVVTDPKGHLPAVSLGAIAKRVGDGLSRLDGAPRRTPRRTTPGSRGAPVRKRGRVRAAA